MPKTAVCEVIKDVDISPGFRGTDGLREDSRVEEEKSSCDIQDIQGLCVIKAIPAQIIRKSLLVPFSY